MFTQLLVGLDGSPQADAALEQAVLLGRRFGSRVTVATVVERAGKAGAKEAAGLLARALFRVEASGLRAAAVERGGEAPFELAELGKGVDVALVGRRGTVTPAGGLGLTVAALIRIAERCVIVCGPSPSPMRACAVAFDGRNHRALELAARYASVVGSTVHVIHAYSDRGTGVRVVGQAEAALSLLGAPFQTHLEAGSAGEVVSRVVRLVRADSLFAGVHVPRGPMERRPSVASHTEEILRHTDLPVVIQP